MLCSKCQRDIGDDSAYCRFCGADQRPPVRPAWTTRRLTRAPEQGKIAGVCAGLAEYFDVDVTLVRLLWVVLGVVPGAIVGGVIAYLAAWLLIPERLEPAAERPESRRLTRSARDRKIAGVCGGLAEFFGVDSTPIRLLWILLTVLPGAFVGGAVAYILAWIVMPPAPAPISALQPSATNG